jgi:hypothetical protein
MSNKKDEIVEQRHLNYLDKLRESGVTNMYGAGAYLEKAFTALTKDESSAILSYWMENFSNEGTKI